MVSLRNAQENQHARAEMHLTTETTATLTTADTYYQLTQNLSDGSTQKFTLLNGTLTYSEAGITSRKFTFIGHAAIKTDKACTVTFALHINDVPVPGCITPADIPVVSKLQHVNCTQIVDLKTGDTISIKVKSSENSTLLTASSFSVVLWGV